MWDVEADNEISHSGDLEQRRARIRSVIAAVPARMDRTAKFAEVAPKAARLSDFSYNCTIRKTTLSRESGRIKASLERRFHGKETHTLMFKPFAKMQTGVNADGTVAFGFNPSSARGAVPEDRRGMFATQLATLESPDDLLTSASAMRKSASLPALGLRKR